MTTKEDVLNYYKLHEEDSIYPSDVAMILNLDLRDVIAIVKELMLEGELELALTAKSNFNRSGGEYKSIRVEEDHQISGWGLSILMGFIGLLIWALVVHGENAWIIGIIVCGVTKSMLYLY